MKAEDVLNFWFEEIDSKLWFQKSEEFDQKVRERFEALYWEIVKGGKKDWLENAESVLALILVLDQFSRNMFRDDPQAFEHDDLALEFAEHAVEKGFDKAIEKRRRSFVYLPYMHSESPEVHEKAMELFKDLGNELNLEYEIKHKEIIDRFGRYPHRNKILGRESTPEELEFLKTHKGF